MEVDYNAILNAPAKGTQTGAPKLPTDLVPPEEPGISDYALDLPKGVINGAVGTIQGLGKLAEWASPGMVGATR